MGGCFGNNPPTKKEGDVLVVLIMAMATLLGIRNMQLTFESCDLNGFV